MVTVGMILVVAAIILALIDLVLGWPRATGGPHYTRGSLLALAVILLGVAQLLPMIH